MGDRVVVVRDVQQTLARNTADVEAGASQSSSALDANGLKPVLGRSDRGNVAARTSSNHAKFEVAEESRNSGGLAKLVVERSGDHFLSLCNLAQI